MRVFHRAPQLFFTLSDLPEEEVRDLPVPVSWSGPGVSEGIEVSNDQLRTPVRNKSGPESFSISVPPATHQTAPSQGSEVMDPLHIHIPVGVLLVMFVSPSEGLSA